MNRHAIRPAALRLLALLVLPLATAQAEPKSSPPDQPGEACTVPGILAGRSSAPNAAPIALPLKKTEVRLNVAAGLVEGTVTQVFTNTSGVPLEAVYVFPLPSEATVTGMELEVGDRVIRSVVKEREEARKEYTEAREQGKKAALLEEERPNIFTTSVANFNPGETARIRFTYLQPADYRSGSYTVNFPMVVGPRYIPFRVAVPDAGRITPPILHPAIDAGHHVDFAATVTGLPVKAITSNTHAIVASKLAGNEGYRVTLREGDALPNAELRLTIELAASADPGVSIVTNRGANATCALVNLLPPIAVDESNLPPRVPRDVLFLIDTSGSMSGDSIGQAQAGLLRCLKMLQPDDRFTIVRFASDYSAFAPDLREATPDRIESAGHYVGSLVADGGTEMQPALDYTLSIPSGRENVLRLVVFLTDGDVGNEDSLMQLLTAKLGNSRVFTFGIGSAPNEFLMRRLAEIGRGQSRFIASHEDIGQTMGDFFRTLDQPAMTNVRLTWRGRGGDTVESVTAYPDPCPDIFVDRPVQVTAMLPAKFDGMLEVTGNLPTGPITFKYPLSEAVHSQHSGIPTLYGRAVVNDLMYQRLRTSDNAALTGLRDRIVATALEFQLITPFTSRVAIEERVTRAPDGGLARVNVPTMLPRGWNPGAFFATASPDPLRFALGFALACLGAALAAAWIASHRRARR